MKRPIVEKLRQVAAAGRVRFHMPGHKGRNAFLPESVLTYDVTELPGTDNLYMPSGVIEESQKLNAPAMDAGACFYLVNGSSIGVQASLLAAAEPGEKVLFARDFHLSAVNGIALAGIKPVFVYPSSRNNYLPSVVTAADFKRAIEENEDAKAIYLTYPNYYGLCPDLNAIAAMSHRMGMTVIVDAAHAAAFSYSEMLPISPGAAGADIWTMSLHKTLSAPNQCAVLCTGEQSLVGQEAAKRAINMLQTTSPSYLLLASMDYALAQMRETGADLLREAVFIIEEFILRIQKLGGYKCVTADIPSGTGAVDRDITKLVIDVTDRGMTGFMAEQKLNRRGIFIEGADHHNIILMCSHANTRRDFEQLAEALHEISGTNYSISAGEDAMHFKNRAQSTTSVRSGMLRGAVGLPMTQAVGHMAACPVGTYPPGVPLILPGQVIEWEDVEHLAALQNLGYTLFGTEGYTLEVSDR